MKEVLADIQDGTFAKRFIADQDAGAPEFKALREKGAQHPIETTGRELRKLMSWVKRPTTTTSRAPPPAERAAARHNPLATATPVPTAPGWSCTPVRCDPGPHRGRAVSRSVTRFLHSARQAHTRRADFHAAAPTPAWSAVADGPSSP